MIKAVLFDFDGVLTLDESGSLSTCKYISSATGITMDVFWNEYKKYNFDLLKGTLKHEEIWDKICEGMGQDISIDVLYDSFINTPINFEMLKVVQELKEKNFKIGMVTDNKADRIEKIVYYHQWHDIFDSIAVSAEIGSSKKEEKIFLSIFERLSVNPEECVFIDNSKENLIVPQNLGVKTIFFDDKKNDVYGLRKELYDLRIDISL